MRTVVISFYRAYPPDSGVSTVTYNVAKYLPGEKHLIQLSERANNASIDGNMNLINLRLLSNNNIIKAANLTLQFPFIIKKIRQLDPEIIILEGASWAVYYLILFYLVKLCKIEAEIIYHSHNVEYLLRKQKNNSIIAAITKWAEGKIIKKSDLCTAVSEADAFNFKKIYGIKPLLLPNGVDVGKFDCVTDNQVQKIKVKYNFGRKNVLFMGLPSFKPNKEAIDFLLKAVFPRVIRENSDAKLSIIGGHTGYRKKWLINPGSIPFEEVPAFIKACDVCVAPIFSGSGTRLKILEYMAAAKPVISTIKGAEGISVNNGEDILIADDTSGFVKKILYMLRNSEQADRIGYKGMKLVKSNYSWQEIMQDFSKALYAVCAKNKKTSIK